MIRRRKPRPGLTLAIGFMIIIAAGTMLLMLPLSHQEGVDVDLIDALFISTSAVCVTGLTPLDISKTLSTFGSTVLMLLIQAGGLGYAVLAVFFIQPFLHIANLTIPDVSSSIPLHLSLS